MLVEFEYLFGVLNLLTEEELAGEELAGEELVGDKGRRWIVIYIGD